MSRTFSVLTSDLERNPGLRTQMIWASGDKDFFQIIERVSPDGTVTTLEPVVESPVALKSFSFERGASYFEDVVREDAIKALA